MENVNVIKKKTRKSTVVLFFLSFFQNIIHSDKSKDGFSFSFFLG